MPYRLPADRLIFSELIRIMLFLACLFSIAQARCGAPSAPHTSPHPSTLPPSPPPLPSPIGWPRGQQGGGRGRVNPRLIFPQQPSGLGFQSLYTGLFN